MKPKQVLYAEVKGGVLVIGGAHSNRLLLLGSSAETAVHDGSGPRDWVSLHPKHGECGVVALSVLTEMVSGVRTRNPQWRFTLVEFSWLRDEIYIDLEQEHIPSVPVDGDTVRFAVEIEGERFVSMGPQAGERQVSGNVLCRFLAGHATAQDVRDAADAVKKERDVKEELKSRISQLESQRDTWGRNKQLLEDQLECAKVVLRAIRGLASGGWPWCRKDNILIVIRELETKTSVSLD